MLYRLDLTPHDVAFAESLLQKPYIMNRPKWVEELKTMLFQKEKAEIQVCVLQSVVVCCTVLHSVVCCCALQSVCVFLCVAVCNRMHRPRFRCVCYSVLQCVATCCSVLQRVAVCCSVFQHVAVCCSGFQFVAVCCSVFR